ncbi:unnamed protein product, partial [marine sediment metagenome]
MGPCKMGPGTILKYWGLAPFLLLGPGTIFNVPIFKNQPGTEP